MAALIKEITATETWPIRHKVMWPNKPVDYIKLAEDAKGQHFALCVDEKIVSVVSIFVNGQNAQFRKFATITEKQGNGYGTQLLKFVFKKLEDSNITVIWCNARKDKIGVYHRFGMLPTSQEFTKGGINYVVMKKLIKKK